MPPCSKELFGFKLTGKDLAIDLGTSKTLVYRRGSGVILDAPSVLDPLSFENIVYLASQVYLVSPDLIWVMLPL